MATFTSTLPVEYANDSEKDLDKIAMEIDPVEDFVSVQRPETDYFSIPVAPSTNTTAAAKVVRKLKKTENRKR